MFPTRRDLLDIVARPAALPGAMEFFSAWLKAAGDHRDGTQPPLVIGSSIPEVATARMSASPTDDIRNPSCRKL